MNEGDGERHHGVEGLFHVLSWPQGFFLSAARVRVIP
ncbi:hypothetical protein PVAP13_3NG302106 [Panicum virgatum]|uniref:Uncharacterized protein n=1 Tax=Panicum virgatum TaxID=38727 RepID=A0A8T0UIJ6_PANVG|nr:hypothetical protein PVAP13_3NG302106 [Panicum virgatum]